MHKPTCYSKSATCANYCTALECLSQHWYSKSAAYVITVLTNVHCLGTSVQAAIPPSSSCASATGSSPSTASPAANDEQDDVLFVEERQGTHDESRPTLTAVLVCILFSVCILSCSLHETLTVHLVFHMLTLNFQKDLKQEDTVLPAALLAAMESTDSPLIPLDMGSLQSPSDRNNQVSAYNRLATSNFVLEVAYKHQFRRNLAPTPCNRWAPTVRRWCQRDCCP